MIPVVRQDTHPPMVGLLSEPDDAERQLVLGVEPARLDVAEAVVVVARRRVGGDVARLVAEDEAGDDVELGDQLEGFLDLESW